MIMDLSHHLDIIFYRSEFLLKEALFLFDRLDLKAIVKERVEGHALR